MTTYDFWLKQHEIVDDNCNFYEIKLTANIASFFFEWVKLTTFKI